MHSDIRLLTLLYSGCIPFLLLNTFTLHLYIHDQVLQVFLSVYAFAAGCFIVLELYQASYWMSLLERYGGQLLLIALAYSVYVLWDRRRRIAYA